MALSVGIVGCGSFGKHFVEPVRDHPEVEHVALCDLDAEKLADCSKRFDIEECYPSLEDLLVTEIDAVMIFTQPWLHAPQAIEAMNAGKHAYTAVPVITLVDGNKILEWCDRLIETAERTGQLYMMGETTCYRPESIFCRRKAATGEFGHYCYSEGHYLHDISHDLKNVARWRWGDQWDDSKRGGIPMHYPTHSTGGIIDITGAHMTHVSAMGYAMPDEDWHLPDTISGNIYGDMVGLYRMSDGSVARIAEMRRIGTPCLETFRIYGTEGSFERNFNGATWLTKNSQEPVDLSEIEDPLPEKLAAKKGGHGGSHAYLVHEFVTACIEERQPRVNAWQAARFVAPGVMAYQSILRSGELLEIPDWGDAPGTPDTG